jgi:hypothetical protein
MAVLIAEADAGERPERVEPGHAPAFLRRQAAVGQLHTVELPNWEAVNRPFAGGTFSFSDIGRYT